MPWVPVWIWPGLSAIGASIVRKLRRVCLLCPNHLSRRYHCRVTAGALGWISGSLSPRAVTCPCTCCGYLDNPMRSSQPCTAPCVCDRFWSRMACDLLSWYIAGCGVSGQQCVLWCSRGHGVPSGHQLCRHLWWAVCERRLSCANYGVRQLRHLLPSSGVLAAVCM